MAIQGRFVGLFITTYLWLGVESALPQEGQLSAELEQQHLVINANAQNALDELLSSNEVARALYEQAYGYAVFGVTKAGFLVSGGAGSGVAVNKATGERVYMRMGTAGLGLSIGVQAYDLVVFFEFEPVMYAFMDGGWDSSVTAQAAAGQEGIAVTSSFVNGVFFYQITDRGLMVAADISGTRFWVPENLN
ncbi:MAG: YSC84-related protein [Pseudomonadota bacterium]|jgi:lipid-binding SYLF domain-containing protein|nr:YSC84-related protein [Pseudomonadota bacterium]